MRKQESITQVFDDMTLQDKILAVTGAMFFPALTVMVFLRRRLGFRRVKINYLLVMTTILLSIGGFSAAPPLLFAGNPTPKLPSFPVLLTPLGIFALAMLVGGIVHNRFQWRDICSGKRWHTYSVGVSWFSFLPLPQFIVHRYVDPFVCIIAGGILWQLSPVLGGWLMFSAIALAGFEQALFDRQLEHNLNTLDGLVSNEVQQETVQHYLGGGTATGNSGTTPRPTGGGNPKTIPLDETAGIPTGIAPDIERQIAERRRKLAEADAEANSAVRPLLPEDRKSFVAEAPQEIASEAGADILPLPEEESPEPAKGERHAIPDNLA